MILTCSNCSKRYLVDPRALGAAGRNVRCAHCGHTWFQAPPPDAPQSFDAALAAAPEPALDERASRRERRVQLPAVSRRRARGPILAWLAAIIVVVAVAWGLIAARASVIDLWPPAARLYAMIGYGETAPGTGLELRKVTPSRGMENGVPTLAIDGEVVNVSSVVRTVPKLRVALRDSNDKELKVWDVTVAQKTLLPGASVSFHTTIAQPAEAATGVLVSFARARKRVPRRVCRWGKAVARILVAEDEAAVSAFMVRGLEHHGHAVKAVPDGLAAVAALAAERFDMLLTDIVMPGLDGIALALKASKDYPAMKILLMTGYSAERQRAHNLAALVHRVLPKPFTLDELVTAVKEELAK